MESLNNITQSVGDATDSLTRAQLAQILEPVDALSRAALGLALRKARQAASLTLKDLSEASGITISMLSRTESGLRDLSLVECVLVCDLMRVGIDDFMRVARDFDKGGAIEKHCMRLALQDEHRAPVAVLQARQPAPAMEEAAA